VIFWVVTPYSFVCGYQNFGGTYRLHEVYFYPEDGGDRFLRNVGSKPKKSTIWSHNTEDHNPRVKLLFCISSGSEIDDVKVKYRPEW
jgi:hypothetical protein